MPVSPPAPDVYPLRRYPRRLLRSLLAFAGAGTLMAGAVWSDGTGGPALPAFLLATAWAIPAIFAWQIRRHGFDPLAALAFTDDGLLATYHDGHRRLLPWRGMARLVAVEGHRNRSWAVLHEAAPALRWFGEVEGEDGFAARLAERSGLAWELVGMAPEDPYRAP